MFAPNYKTPRSLQINVGIQHEIKPGMVLSVDYVRNVTTQLLVGEDLNQTGNVKYFNSPAANWAINTTNASFGCPPGSCRGQLRHRGRGDHGQLLGAMVWTRRSMLAGTCANNPYGCAFGGLNPKAPSLQFLVPASRSSYNALDYQVHRPGSESDQGASGT